MTSIAWADLRVRLIQLLSTYAGAGIVLLLLLMLLLVLPWYAKGHKEENGVVTYPNAALVNPILAGIGATLLVYAAIRQAQTASSRHEAQTEADRQRRITESFSKAVEQLGSDKLEVRLGGIYALERLSQESPRDYWTVMENLTAFVRERTRRAEAERTAKPLDQRIAEAAYSLWEKAGRPEGRSKEFWAEAVRRERSEEPPRPTFATVLTMDFSESWREPPATDIAAVLTVIQRRSAEHRAREATEMRVLDFRQAVLWRTALSAAHLERASFSEAHLEGADLGEAHLEGANLGRAHLQGANLSGAHLEGADLSGAHLERADLGGAHLERADLRGTHLKRAILRGAHFEDATLWSADLNSTNLGGAHLEGARLRWAHLEGANLRRARGITQEQIDTAFGDAETKLPRGLARPADWTQPERGAEPAA